MDDSYALLVKEASGEILVSHRSTELLESSSTIKVPIITLALKQMKALDHSLETRLERLPRHSSRGAGILNWTDSADFSIEQLLFTTLVYSDCLATNMLIDYIGGTPKLNKWLAKQELKTRLKMNYLYFTDDEESLPNVGITSCDEMLHLFSQLEDNNWPEDVKNALIKALGSVHESWLEINIDSKPVNLRHKTGSMIRSSLAGDTILNAVGSFKKNGKKYYFCLLSAGRANTNNQVQALKKQMARKLGVAYRNL